MNKIAAMSITAVAMALSIGLAARGVSAYKLSHPATLGGHTSDVRARIRDAQLTPDVRYRIVELPGLGGPATYPSNSRPCCQIINNAGFVAYSADTPASDPYCGNPDCHVSHTASWQNGLFADLGALPGSVSGSAAGATNASGWIVGVSDNGKIDPPTGLPAFRAVLWKDGRIVDLGSFGGNFNLAVAVNNAGQVVGAASDTVDDAFPLFLGTTRTRAFLWQAGVLQDLGTLGGPDAFALSINQSGQVAGFSYTNATPNSTTQIPTVHPFLWDHGKMTDLGALGGTLSGAENVVDGMVVTLNDRGQVASASTLAGDQTMHPFLWDRGTLTDLGTLGGDNGMPQWLTDNGDVVGWAEVTPGSQIRHAFLWRNGFMTDLGTLGTNSTAITENSSGQIVGRSFVPSVKTQHAFLWENGGPMKDLNDLIPSGTNLVLQEAENINDRGEILVWADPPGCGDDHVCGRLVLLVPCGASSPCVDVNVDAASARSVSAAMSAHTSSPTRRVTRVLAPSWRSLLDARYKLRRSAD